MQRVFDSLPTDSEIKPRDKAIEKWVQIGVLNAKKLVQDGIFTVEKL